MCIYTHTHTCEWWFERQCSSTWCLHGGAEMFQCGSLQCHVEENMSCVHSGWTKCDSAAEGLGAECTAPPTGSPLPLPPSPSSSSRWSPQVLLLNVFMVMDVALWSRLAGLATCHLTLYSPLIYFIFLFMAEAEWQWKFTVRYYDWLSGGAFIYSSISSGAGGRGAVSMLMNLHMVLMLQLNTCHRFCCCWGVSLQCHPHCSSAWALHQRGSTSRDVTVHIKMLANYSSASYQ